MPTLELTAEVKALYRPSAKEPALVTVPSLLFLMVDGSGSPLSK